MAQRIRFPPLCSTFALSIASTMKTSVPSVFTATSSFHRCGPNAFSSPTQTTLHDWFYSPNQRGPTLASLTRTLTPTQQTRPRDLVLYPNQVQVHTPSTPLLTSSLTQARSPLVLHPPPPKPSSARFWTRSEESWCTTSTWARRGSLSAWRQQSRPTRAPSAMVSRWTRSTPNPGRETS